MLYQIWVKSRDDFDDNVIKSNSSSVQYAIKVQSDGIRREEDESSSSSHTRRGLIKIYDIQVLSVLVVVVYIRHIDMRPATLRYH